MQRFLEQILFNQKVKLLDQIIIDLRTFSTRVINLSKSDKIEAYFSGLVDGELLPISLIQKEKSFESSKIEGIYNLAKISNYDLLSKYLKQLITTEEVSPPKKLLSRLVGSQIILPIDHLNSEPELFAIRDILKQLGAIEVLFVDREFCIYQLLNPKKHEIITLVNIDHEEITISSFQQNKLVARSKITESLTKQLLNYNSSIQSEQKIKGSQVDEIKWNIEIMKEQKKDILMNNIFNPLIDLISIRLKVYESELGKASGRLKRLIFTGDILNSKVFFKLVSKKFSNAEFISNFGDEGVLAVKNSLKSYSRFKQTLVTDFLLR